MADGFDPLAFLAHVEKIIDDRIKRAINEHNAEKSEPLHDIKQRLTALEKGINAGFPHDDPEAHRKVHEQYITDAADRRELRKDVISNIVKAVVMGAGGMILIAIWDYIKVHSK